MALATVSLWTKAAEDSRDLALSDCREGARSMKKESCDNMNLNTKDYYICLCDYFKMDYDCLMSLVRRCHT
jgi:hypothetical protein